MILPMHKSRLAIIEMIYKNGKTKVSDLWRKTSVSPKVMYECLADLKKSNVVKEERVGAKMRMIMPNLGSESGRLVFSLLELEKRTRFFGRHPDMSGAFEHLERELPENGAVKTAVVFGSFSREAETEESDLDLLFVTTSRTSESAKKRLERVCETCFVSLPVHVSSRVVGRAGFKSAIFDGRDAVVNSILKDHVCVFNCMGWVETIA